MMSGADIAGSPAHLRELRVSRAFVTLADTLVTGFDVAEFLHTLTGRVVDLLDVSAAAVILIDRAGALRVAATSTHRAELLELFAVQIGTGPCVDCVRSGQPVTTGDLAGDERRWPRFAAAARECGFRTALALPMRLRDQVIGVLTLLNAAPGGPDDASVQLAQALADVATIGILQHQAIQAGDQVKQQLEAALSSRVAIEQAKGVLAQRGDLSMDDAFARLRGYARHHNLGLTSLAHHVAQGTADLDAILTHQPGRR